MGPRIPEAIPLAKLFPQLTAEIGKLTRKGSNLLHQVNSNRIGVMKPMGVLALMEPPRLPGAWAFITAAEPAPAGMQVAFKQDGRVPASIGNAAITENTGKAHLFGRDLAKRSTTPGIRARPPIAALIPCKAGSAVPFTQNGQEHQPHGHLRMLPVLPRHHSKAAHIQRTLSRR